MKDRRMKQWTKVSFEDLCQVTDCEEKMTRNCIKFLLSIRRIFLSTWSPKKIYKIASVAFADPFLGVKPCIKVQNPMIIRLILVRNWFRWLRTTISELIRSQAHKFISHISVDQRNCSERFSVFWSNCVRFRDPTTSPSSPPTSLHQWKVLKFSASESSFTKLVEPSILD